MTDSWILPGHSYPVAGKSVRADLFSQVPQGANPAGATKVRIIEHRVHTRAMTQSQLRNAISAQADRLSPLARSTTSGRRGIARSRGHDDSSTTRSRPSSHPTRARCCSRLCRHAPGCTAPRSYCRCGSTDPHTAGPAAAGLLTTASVMRTYRDDLTERVSTPLTCTLDTADLLAGHQTPTRHPIPSSPGEGTEQTTPGRVRVSMLR